MEKYLEELEKGFKKLLEELKSELLSIRTGRATPALIENIKVTTYEGTTKLKLLELATITNQDSQTLLIAPFDPNTLSDIEKAIQEANLGTHPKVQGKLIYLKFPPLTAEQREKIKKIIGEIVEEYRVKTRGLRDNIRKQIKTAFENSEISEDVKFALFKKIDELTKKQNQEIEEIKQRKISEVINL